MLLGSLGANLQTQLASARLHDFALELPLALLFGLMVTSFEATLVRT